MDNNDVDKLLRKMFRPRTRFQRLKEWFIGLHPNPIADDEELARCHENLSSIYAVLTDEEKTQPDRITQDRKRMIAESLGIERAYVEGCISIVKHFRDRFGQ